MVKPVKTMVQIHAFDGRYYISVNAGPMRPATVEEVREALGL